MKKRLFTVALGMLSIPLMGGAAYAAVTSVSESPKPQIVIPASPISTASNPTTHDVRDDRRVAPAASMPAAPRDNPASHDVRDDRRVAPVTVAKASDDNPATHEAGDDRSLASVAATKASDDNPATHEVGDDRSVAPVTQTTVKSDDNPATHDVGDTHGGSTGSPGSSSASGSDDPTGHA